MSDSILLTPSYVYDELPEHYVRVLKITAVEPRIVCSLESYPLDKAPAFHAVSYAWGDKGVIHVTILCDDQELLVTPHLHEGLRRMTVSTGVEFLWVDAICIDQCNNQEKAQQVRQMHTIFKTAAAVFIWLGEEDETSTVAMSSIRSMRTAIKILAHRHHDYHGAFMMAGLPPPERSVWTAISKLYNRSWMHRVWVIQEVLLARQLSVFCGNTTLDWESFAQFSVNISIALSYIPPYLVDSGLSAFLITHGLKTVRELEQFRKSSLRGREPMNFMTLVDLGRRKECKYPIDRVYGLLGFAVGDTFREAIPVDYSPDTLACYWKTFILFGKAAITSSPGLRLLSIAYSEHRLADLPSWCPDLSVCGGTFVMSRQYRAWTLPESDASFSDFTENVTTNPGNARAIEITGAQLDVIDSVSPCPISIETLRSSIWTWLDECLEKAQLTYKSSHGKLPEAFWRTMFADIGGDGRFPSSSRGFNHYLVTRYWFQFHRDFSSIKSSECALTEPWLVRFRIFWPNRAFFTTKGGRVGFGAINVRPGDLVCILYSGPTIYVLRRHPVKQTYEFVCDGYTHGFMHGEGLEMIKSGEIKTQRFTLE